MKKFNAVQSAECEVRSERKNYCYSLSPAPRTPHVRLLAMIISAGLFFSASSLVKAEDNYVEPGTLRLSHTLSLESVLHKLKDGWSETPTANKRSRTFSVVDEEKNPWKAEWGQRLLTEAAARFSKSISARVLFEAQGEYADRYWRPINANHDAKLDGDDVFVRELEGKIEQQYWYVHAFEGVPRSDWRGRGDFFQLYPQAIGTRDYLGSSSFFGIYPSSWRQDQYFNISEDRVPRGVEGGLTFPGLEAAVAYGDELGWGFRDSTYGLVRSPIGKTKVTFVFKNEDVPYSVFDQDEVNEAYAVSIDRDFEAGHRLQAGVLYNPFRVDRTYQTAEFVGGAGGVQGSGWQLGTDTTKRSDAWGARARYEHVFVFLNRLWTGAMDLTRKEILAGNKEKGTVELGSEVTTRVKGLVQYTYQRPIEGPIPFLYEGTPSNIGNIVANPRGPESPFTVNQDNREAVFLVTTFVYDPTPGTSFLIYDPAALSMWNVNPGEDSGVTFGVQYRMSDYRTTTDRQWYIDENGTVVFEPAASSGAFPTKHPLHEFRFLGQTKAGSATWTLGVAGGQQTAVSGLAYDNDTVEQKPLTEYFSIEGRFDLYPWGLWAHYGSGVWGPEENIHPFFGLSYDRLWGAGFSYNVTKNTTWDMSYLAARQDDSLFTAPDLGSFDEIRTVLSHRFGFLAQFAGPSRRGFQAR